MLPPGFGLTLDPATRRTDGGRVLIGGSPLRIVRLTPAGAAVVDGWTLGAAVRPASASLARRLLDAGMAHPVPPPSGLTTDDVTIVIPVRDGPVPSVGPAHAVIVVDDGSVTPIPDAVRHDVARGPAAARNTGWRAATTPLVAFVDADCIVPDRWLEALLPHFADPAVLAVAPRVMASPSPGVLGTYESARSPLDRGPSPGLVRPRGRVPFVPSAALVVRRSALEQAGGFDESMRFGEDVDLVWRLAGAVRYEPASVVSHPRRGSLPAWLRQRFDYGTSAAPLARRHGRAVTPLAVSAWSFGAWVLAVAGRRVAGAAVAAGSSALLAPRLSSLEHPWRETAELAGKGNLYAGLQIADALRRAWWPLLLVSRRARWAAVAALLVEWWRDKPPLDPVTWVGLRLADDLAYGAGVLVGCWRSQSVDALIPDLASWPGRRPAVEPA